MVQTRRKLKVIKKTMATRGGDTMMVRKEPERLDTEETKTAVVSKVRNRLMHRSDDAVNKTRRDIDAINA